jgi:hypothetical protein
MIAITLLLTIAGALGLGIVLGYGLITGILQIMGHRPEVKPAVALVTQAHGGD